MSVSSIFYETITFSPAIPTLSYYRGTLQETPFDRQNYHMQEVCEALARASICSKSLVRDPELMQPLEASTIFLKRLGSCEETRASESSCLYGLISGIAASFLFKNPLSLLIGLSECFPRAYAQQKVGNEFQVNTYITNSQRYPSVTSFSNGNFVVTWESNGQDGSREGIYGQLFNGTGTKIGNEFQVNAYTNLSQSYPSVASFSNGNFVVTWSSDGQDGSMYGAYGQLFNGNCIKIGSEFQANSYTTNDQTSPSVASFGNGNFVVTWGSYGQDGSGMGVYGQLLNGNGAKIGSEFRANSYTIKSQCCPSVASLVDGSFVVTWMSDQRSFTNDVFGQLFNGNGTKIGNEFQANSYTTNDQRVPSVASFSNGNFVVTWDSNNQDGDNWGVFGQLFDGNGTKIGSEFQANSYVTSGQWYPSVASFSNGNFVVTWGSFGQDGSFTGIYGQLFDGNGTKIGSEFRANSFVTLEQTHPSVASFNNGNFVVTWESNGQDGSFDGIHGQIFHDNITTYPSSSSTTSPSSTSTTRPITTSNSRVTLSTSSYFSRMVSVGGTWNHFLFWANGG